MRGRTRVRTLWAQTDSEVPHAHLDRTAELASGTLGRSGGGCVHRHDRSRLRLEDTSQAIATEIEHGELDGRSASARYPRRNHDVVRRGDLRQRRSGGTPMCGGGPSPRDVMRWTPVRTFASRARGCRRGRRRIRGRRQVRVSAAESVVRHSPRSAFLPMDGAGSSWTLGLWSHSRKEPP